MNQIPTSIQLDQLVEHWKGKLIDLSRRNRLLYFRENRDSTLLFSQPKLEDIFTRLVVKEKPYKIWIPPQDESRSNSLALVQIPLLPKELLEKAKAAHRAGKGAEAGKLLLKAGVVPPQIESLFEEFTGQTKLLVKEGRSNTRSKVDELVCEGANNKNIERILKNLHQRAQIDYIERGIRTLYMAFGTLVWKEMASGDDIYSPLIMCSVILKKENVNNSYTVSLAEDECVLNPALQVKLRKNFNIGLPQLPKDWDPHTLEKYLESINQLIQSWQWKIQHTAILGLFSFHKLVMHEDLKINASRVKSHEIVRALGGEPLDPSLLANIPNERGLDSILKPEVTFQILDADSSQQVCIQAALQGRSFVLQGPPGTGKSQTIANIIAEFIAREKSVLFVSEKIAALEVVFERLKKVGLDTFCLELHSHKANKREVVTELKRCLDAISTKHVMQSEYDFENLTKLRARLNDYVLALHTVREPLSISAFSALAKLTELHDVPLIPFKVDDMSSLRLSQVREWENQIGRLATVWSLAIENDSFPWSGFHETQLPLARRANLDTLLRQIIESLGRLQGLLASFADCIGVKAPSNLREAHWHAQIASHLNRRPPLKRNWLISDKLKLLIEEAKDQKTKCSDFKRLRDALKTKFNNAIVRLDPNTAKRLWNSWTQIATLLGLNDKNEQGVFQNSQRILQVFKRAQIVLMDCRSASAGLSARFDLATGGMDLHRAQKLAQLVLLSNSKIKPELTWLNEEHLSEIKAFIKRNRVLYEKYNRQRIQLLQNYNSDFFSLDFARLRKNFEGGSYHNFWRWLHPKFYQDRNAILKTTCKRELPSSFLNDLRAGHELMQFQARLNIYQEDITRLLGKYNNGLETDFDSVEQAMNIASEALKLAGSSTIPRALGELIVGRTDLPADIQAKASRILTAIMEWDECIKELEILLPLDRRTEFEATLGKCSLEALSVWVEKSISSLIDFHNLIDQTQQCYRTEPPHDLSTLLADLSGYEKLLHLSTQFKCNSDSLRISFGEYFNGLETDWDSVLTSLEWARELREFFHFRPLPEPLINLVASQAEQTTLANNLVVVYEKLISLVVNLEELFDPPLLGSSRRDLREITFGEFHEKVQALLERLDDLQSWLDLKGIKKMFATSGLSAFYAELEKQQPPASLLLPIFQKGLFHAWINGIFESDSRLGAFRGQDHEKIIADFRTLDKELIRLAARRVIDKCHSRCANSILSLNSERTLILTEAAKKRKHLPLRNLFERTSGLLRQIKPCFMMSPLSVSQFLHPEKNAFDLVIFDEASQVFTEDAVGAIYRGKQLIVAGDSKQLPPTDFFRSLNDDGTITEESASDDQATFVSVLDQCGTILPSIPQPCLRWHYRSECESLIAFSNSRFYDNSLITFPSAQYEHDSLGVKFVYVSTGEYDRGGKRDNPVEAKVVVDKVFEQFERYPEKNLIVVTFSQAQKTAIEDEIERRRKSQPEFDRFFKDDHEQGRLTDFAVKSLEDVQGDERDVVIFSVGYGRDKNGRLTMHFGPLNISGGERRLNVAITRAREKVIVVSSIRSSDFDLRSNLPPGVLSLYRYLDYAEHGPKSLELTSPQGRGDYESPFERDVASEIRRMGYDVIPQVGCSGFRIDLGIIDPRNPGRFILGVECDGATYHSAATARDRDRLRQEILEKLGWRIHRVWSPDWITKRNTEIRRIKQTIQNY